MFLRLFLYFTFTLGFFVLFQNCSNKAFEKKAISPKKNKISNGAKMKIGNIIHYNGVDNLHLGDPFKKVWELFSPSQIKYYDGYGYGVSKGDSLLFLFNSYDSLHITSIDFGSSKFITDQGVSPGMSIMEVKKIFPNMWLEINQIDLTEEIYTPESLKVQKNDTCFRTKIKFSRLDEDKFIGDYQGSNVVTRKFNTNGVVLSIEVWLRSGIDCE